MIITTRTYLDENGELAVEHIPESELYIVPLPPVSFDDLPKFERVGSSSFIRRETMTRAEFARRFPEIPPP